MATQFQLGKKALTEKILKAIEEFEDQFHYEVLAINVAQMKARTDKPEDDTSVTIKPSA
jgi:hypothetical protein